jgi:hypothetical protein
MTTQQVIALLARRLQTVNSSLCFEDLTLLQALEDARALLAVKVVSGMSGYTIDPSDTETGISPDLSEDDAYPIVLQAALDLLQQRYADLTQSGALGVVWKSGLEEESTVTVERAYRNAVNAIRRELEAVLLIRMRATSATRVQ